MGEMVVGGKTVLFDDDDLPAVSARSWFLTRLELKDQRIKELEHANEAARLAIVGLEAKLALYADLEKAARDWAEKRNRNRRDDTSETRLLDLIAALDKKGE